MLEIIKNLLKRTGTLFSEVKNIKKRLLFLEENPVEIPEIPDPYEAPYKVYTALLTQTGTNAPTANVLQNTIGTSTWSYDSAGNYTVTCTGCYTENKTFVLFTCLNNLDPSAGPLSNGYWINNTNSISIKINYYGSGSDENEWLVNSPIEIRVYP